MLRKFNVKALAGACLLLSAGCVSAQPEASVVGDYLSGRFAARTNEVAAAASAFEDAQKEFSNTDEVLRRAFLYQLAAGEIDGAASLAGKVLDNEDEEDDDLARLTLAAQAIRHGEYKKAQKALSANAEASYLAAPMTILKAWSVAGVEGPEAALKILAQKDGETFRGFHPLHQAFLFEKAGLMEEAETTYQLSLATYGGLVGVDAYGAFLERAGDEGAAEEFYNRVIENRGLSRVIAKQGLKRIKKKKTSKAFADVAPAQGSAIALHSFAQAILEQIEEQRDAAQKAGFRIGDPNYDMPLALIRISLYLDPEFDHAQWLAGRILNIYGDSEYAIEMMKRIPSSSPFFEQAQIDVAAGLLELDRTDEALKVLHAASQQPDAVDEARFQYANLLMQEKRFKDAVKVFDGLIAELPADPPGDVWRFYVARAAAYLEQDAWPKAEKDLVRAVEIAPKEAVALNYLGYSWAERGENLEKAFELIEQAVALQPNSGAYIDSLGWAHYQRGDYKTAVGHLEHAASLEPADPTITDHLGDVYWRLDRKIEAHYQWRHVLELEPSDKLRRSIEKKLEEGLPETSE